MSHPPSTRRRGGQPGNLNRLKHGLYSRRLASTPADPKFELTLARRRLAQLLQKQESASLRDYLSYERGILHYLSVIIALSQSAVRSRPSARIDPPQSTDPIDGDGHPYAGIMESIRPFNTEAPGDSQASGLGIRTSKRRKRNDP